MSVKNRWAMFAVLPALLAGAAEVEAARFHFLGGLAFGSETRVSDVSTDGATAVGSTLYFSYDGTHHIFPQRWNADGEPLLAFSFEGAAEGVSADGSVAVGNRGGEVLLPGLATPPSGEAFRWTSDSGVVGLGYLTEDVTYRYSSAFAVSADGSTVVGQSFSDSGYRAFRCRQSEGMVSLGILPGDVTSSATNISADGSVIVGSSGTDSADEAFRWTAEGGMVGLGRLRDHLHSYAEDVSADGSVVVGSSGNRTRWAAYPLGSEPAEDYEAFVWTEADGMVGLGYLPGHGWSQAYAVSADGSIVVGASAPVLYDGQYHSVGIREAFVWDAEHGMRSLRDILVNEYQLELPDWSLGYPTGISADGKVIVGNSDYGAWMVVIPEPCTIVLTLTGLLGVLVYTWRRGRRASRALQCRPRPLAAWSVLLAVPLLLCAAEVEAASFRVIGEFYGEFMTNPQTTVSGVSADGSTAVGSYSYTYPRRWNADGVGLGDFGGRAWGVSDNGSVVVGETETRAPDGSLLSREAFRWTPQTGALGLGYLHPGGTYSSASDVSADGSIVVGRSHSGAGYRAFRWTQSEGMVGLGTLSGDNWSQAESVSADGSVVVGSSSFASWADRVSPDGSVVMGLGDTFTPEAFRWTADGGMVGLGWLGNHLESSAHDVSADGLVVVGRSGPGLDGAPGVPPGEAFLWTEAEGMVGLGYLPGHRCSEAYAVSADGSIVVGASASVEDHGEFRSVGTPEAFIWDAEHGMRSLRDLFINEYQLELPYGPLGYPSDISSDGTVIVGSRDCGSSGVGFAWIAVIPEPATIVLALIGLPGLLAYAWRKRRRAA